MKMGVGKMNELCPSRKQSSLQFARLYTPTTNTDNVGSASAICLLPKGVQVEIDSARAAFFVTRLRRLTPCSSTGEEANRGHIRCPELPNDIFYADCNPLGIYDFILNHNLKSKRASKIDLFF